MRLFLLAAAGGAIGSGARYLVNVAAARALGPHFPWSTLIVNVVGCLLMGIVAELVMRRLGGSPEARVFLATGILGGFTTFSAFALDFNALMQADARSAALLYVLASVGLSIGAVYAGLMLGKAVL
jgi:CrcB protein